MKAVPLLRLLPLLLALSFPDALSAQDPPAPAGSPQSPTPNIPGLPGRPIPGASAPAASQVATQSFRFTGGSVYEFMRALGKEYGTNLLELFDVPQDIGTLVVPKMRVHSATDIRNVLSTYNSISEAGDWYLGKWIFYPKLFGYSVGEVSTVVFSPPKPQSPESGSGIAVRAFSIAGLSPAHRNTLREIVEEEAAKLRDLIARGYYGRQDGAQVNGRISIHESTELLVATGGKTYVELVTSVVEAFEKKNKTLR